MVLNHTNNSVPNELTSTLNPRVFLRPGNSDDNVMSTLFDVEVIVGIDVGSIDSYCCREKIIGEKLSFPS